MAEITMNDLKDTYIRLVKDAPVYNNPYNADAGKPVWFMKKKGEIAGKVFMWITPEAPMDFKGVKNAYLCFKINDDFYNPNAYWYFIKYDKGLIDWNFTKQELQKKAYLDMSLFERFVTTMERNVSEVMDYAKSGFKTGLALAAGILFINFVVVPEVKFRRMKATARELIREAKK